MSALSATHPSANTTGSTGGVAALYHQCGGINWTGATKCEAGSYCKVQNDFYFQCVANEGAYTNATATGSNADYINTLLASGPASARPTTLVTITASSSAATTPTSTAEDDDDDYCEDEEPATVSASATPTPSAAAASEDNDYCEDEETVTVSASATPTPSAAAASEEEDDDDHCEE